MIIVDLHTHTNCSDGILSPREVVTRASKNSVKYLAITDHDTIDGLEEGKMFAKELGINFIPGIELSTTYKGESIHILGFFRDDSYKDKEFLAALESIKNHRLVRAKNITKKLKEEFNIEINYENILKRGKDVVARPHIAEEIIASGYNYTKDYIFDNFIGNNCKAFVPTTHMTPKEGVKLLKKYNAMVFLAHPVLIKKSSIEEFLDFGIDGIEAIYFQNTPKDEHDLLIFANDHDLLISAGSDCHGDLKGDKRHGDIGCMSMAEGHFEKFLARLQEKDSSFLEKN